jgi:hypothetical protein
MALIAMSASYGAGGSIVGPALAERLDVPFIDRAISLAVADRLEVPVEEAALGGETGAGWLERLLRGYMGGDTIVPTPLPAEAFSSEDFRRATEDAMLAQAATGAGVFLGRGSVAVLREDRRVMRVRLDGPPEGRIRRAMQLHDLDREAAERAVRQFDRAHAGYLRQLYGVQIEDPALYHVMVDSTAIDLEACVDLLERAARAFGRA